MAHQINLTHDHLSLEVAKVLTGRGFITGKSGAGKSNTAGLICERLLDQNFPLLIIDTDGEYYGLKEVYELLHLGADEECDLQIGVEHAQKVTQLALEKNLPVILDASGYLELREVKKLIEETLHHLFNKEKKMKKPFLVLIEEIHEYLPELPSLDECGKMIVQVAKRGRKRGLGLIGLSQRPADVKKDFITQCNWRVWHRLDWETDLKVVRRVLGKDYVSQIQELEVGQAILEADFLDKRISRVNFQRKKTFDAGATPDLDTFERPKLKSVSKDLVSELQQITEQRKRRRSEIEQLRQENRKLEEKIIDLEEELEKARDMQDLAHQFTEAMSSSPSPELQRGVLEIKEEKFEQIRRLKKEKNKLQDKVSDLEGKVSILKRYEKYKDKVEEWESRKDVIKEALLRLKDVLDLEVDQTREKYRRKLRQYKDRIDKLERQVRQREEQVGFIGSDRYERIISNLARRGSYSEETYELIIKELSHGEASLAQLATATGRSKATIRSALPQLKQQGWVKKIGDRLRLAKEISRGKTLKP